MVRIWFISRALTLCVFWSGVTLLGVHSARARASEPERLNILTSHPPALIEEFERGFRSYYQKRFKKDVFVDWLDQGSPARNFKYAVQLAAAKSHKFPIDILWGGGVDLYLDLQKLGALVPLNLNKSTTQVLDRLAIPQEEKMAKDGTWVASMLASYGIMVNWASLKEKTTDLGTGARELTLSSLTLPGFKNLILVLDPRRSATFAAICNSIIRSQGWEAGMQLIESYFVHSRTIARREIAALDAISRGRVGATFVADYHALNLMLNFNRPELEFSSISSPRDLSADPIAILKGTENNSLAQQFVQFVMSKEGQGLLQLNKGAVGGPSENNLGRISIRPEIARSKVNLLSNPFNPFAAPKENPSPSSEASIVVEVPSDLITAIIGTVYVDQHQNWLRLEDQNPPRSASAKRDVWLGVAFLPKAPDLHKLVDRWKQEKNRAKILESIQKNVDSYFASRLGSLNDGL